MHTYVCVPDSRSCTFALEFPFPPRIKNYLACTFCRCTACQPRSLLHGVLSCVLPFYCLCAEVGLLPVSSRDPLKRLLRIQRSRAPSVPRRGRVKIRSPRNYLVFIIVENGTYVLHFSTLPCLRVRRHHITTELCAFTNIFHGTARWHPLPSRCPDDGP